ncbi:type IV pilus biogenesis protein PilM [Fictibacillus iocasae]|uniref:Type IV pilus biogenesis protein PilM n=1 Tax=Fictibacillus iocasae TaxID=2715437 RepID=A0ABW2NUI6_9BACL
MKFGLGLFNRKRVNLIIQDHVIRFLEYKDPEELDVRNFGERYLPEGLIQEGAIKDRETLLLILEECVSDWGIKGRDVQFLIPDGRVVIRKQQIPSDLMEDEIKGYLYMELGSSIHVPFEDPVFEFAAVQGSGEAREILLFAASEQLVHDYSSLLEEVKLKPVVADISCLALYRFVYVQNETESDDHSLCVQFDLASVQISIFHYHMPFFYNSLKLEHDMKQWDVKHHISEVQDITFQGESQQLLGAIDDSIKEVERILNYYKFNMNAGQQGVTKVFLTGDHPKLAYVKQQIEQQLNMPVVQLEDDVQRLPSKFHSALGLGLKEVELC